MNSLTAKYDDKGYYRSIINDIISLSSENLYKSYYGSYYSDPNELNKKNSYCFATLHGLLQKLNVDTQLNINFYNYCLSQGIYDAGWSDDMKNYFVELYDAEIVCDTVNTYNYENEFERILQFCIISIDGEDYIVLQIHNGKSDARCGYSTAFIYQIDDSDYNIFDLIGNYSISIDGKKNYYINVSSSEAYIYFYDTNETVYIQKYDFLESLQILRDAGIKYHISEFEY